MAVLQLVILLLTTNTMKEVLERRYFWYRTGKQLDFWHKSSSRAAHSGLNTYLVGGYSAACALLFGLHLIDAVAYVATLLDCRQACCKG